MFVLDMLGVMLSCCDLYLPTFGTCMSVSLCSEVVFLNLIWIAGWTIERGIKQGSHCRIEIVFGSRAWAGNIYTYGCCSMKHFII